MNSLTRLVKNWCKSHRLTEVIRVEFGKGVKSEADAVLGRGKTNVSKERGDDGRVLAVRVEAEQTVNLVDGVL